MPSEDLQFLVRWAVSKHLRPLRLHGVQELWHSALQILVIKISGNGQNLTWPASPLPGSQVRRQGKDANGFCRLIPLILPFQLACLRGRPPFKLRLPSVVVGDAVLH